MTDKGLLADKGLLTDKNRRGLQLAPCFLPD
ncbi:hypothetical protein YPC_3078 [Yersinia pestis biovar Medievalis str. Harbin 35]|nr:hypothetical protein YPC_3078 [Yersinia pestis biovar Medievalis str. Harbin 35]EEO77694.1 hypothetical protein YP516_1374 [Yersinia pestis Nepal516]EEO80051.1 hypothetical protein YPF_3483 [Yersinia pestis biovar Orientalis str. India 195]EEO89954.1 hypothetical protein YPS_2956 [Yersinia pestis Pestoides A]